MLHGIPSKSDDLMVWLYRGWRSYSSILPDTSVVQGYRWFKSVISNLLRLRSRVLSKKKGDEAPRSLRVPEFLELLHAHRSLNTLGCTVGGLLKRRFGQV